MNAHVGEVSAQVHSVEEFTLLGCVKEVEHVVGADGQAVVVRLTVVTAHNTVLGEVTQREVVVHFLGGTADADVVLHDGCIVIEQQLLPVGTETDDFVAVGVSQVVRIDIEGRQTVLEAAFVLQDSIIGSTSHGTLSPCALPAVGEVVVDAGLAHLAFLGRHEDDTIGSACTVDGARGGIFQYFHTLNIIGVHAFHTILVGGHTVNDVEGVGVVDGADTADANHRLSTRLTGR